MTFIITIYVKEGIIMASDSRQTLDMTQQRQGRQITQLAVTQSDTIYKIYLTKDGVGISTFGQADINGTPISGFIEHFINSLPLNRTVSQVANDILIYFRRIPSPPRVKFHVAGYENDANGIPQQHVYEIDVHNNSNNRKNVIGQCGAGWGGENDIFTRLIKPVFLRQQQGNRIRYLLLPHFDIAYQYFTLQDAIDFTIYAIKVTIDTMKFFPRPKTVGGPIDVLAIKPDRAWFIQRKQLHGDS